MERAVIMPTGGDRRLGVLLLPVGWAAAGLGWTWPALAALLLGFLLATRRVHGLPFVLAAVVTAGGLVLVAARAGLDAAALGLGRATLLPGLLWSLLLMAAVGVAVAGATRVGRLRPLFSDARYESQGGRETLRGALIDIPLGTVLVEELAFRGVVLALLLSSPGPVWAIAISSALFGLWHVASALEMHSANDGAGGLAGPLRTVMVTVALTALAGAGLALLRLWTGSLLPAAALHWAVNGWGTAATWWVARSATA